MTTRILNAECAILEAATEVLFDLGTIDAEEYARLREIAGSGRYSPNDAALVRLALESYADAHGAIS